MGSARDIARELLPYVVVLWATFALLGGALENSRSAEAESGSVAVKSGIGLCAITVACIVRGTAERIRPLRWRIFEFSEPARLRPVLGATPAPLAYHEPPPLIPSLQLLQILRA